MSHGRGQALQQKVGGEKVFLVSQCVCQQKAINEINLANAECTLTVLISTHKVFSTHFPPSLLSRNEKAAWWSLATNIQRIEQLALQVQLSHGRVNIVVQTWPKCIGSHAGSQICSAYPNISHVSQYRQNFFSHLDLAFERNSAINYEARGSHI